MIKVQIIEDYQQDIYILENAIKSSGLEIDITVSRSIEEAIDVTSKNNFDCIFLDYYFPKQNGSDFLKYYSSKNKSGNIIMVTSQEDVHMAVECMKLGASDFLTKNQITPASIGKSLRYVLKIKEAREDAERAEAALLESEFKLKNIIAKSPIILFNIDKTGKITLFRGKAAFNLSIKPEAVIDRNLSEFTNELPIRREDFNKACTTNETNYKTAVNGHHFDVNYIPIRNEDKQINGMMGVAIDITSFIKNEEELMNTIEVKEGSAKIKEQFLANMSHEIRTPIHGIISLTQFVLNTSISEEQKKYLDLIRKSADTLLVIVNDILDLSKIDSGKLVFEETPFSIKDTLQTAVASFIPKTTEKNIELKTEVSKNLPDTLAGDPVRLTQIINNLLGNAVKFTDKGSVRIVVNTLEQNSTHIVLEFRISDTGIGIPAHKIDSIFESFTQAGDDITRKYGGTGLGLTITKQLIERQNGSIHVESIANEGTTFIFHIPYKICIENNQEIVKEKKNIIHLPSELKVLIAEDHDINRFIIEKMFKEWGLTPTFAITGVEAVKAAKEQIFDVILMDIEMPDMNGYRATEIIRAELPYPNNTVPIIAMTGHAMAGEKEKCIGIGMNDYLSKPFKPEDLKQRIADLTGKSVINNTPDKQAQSAVTAAKETAPIAETSVGSRPLINLGFLKEISENNDQFFVEFIQMFLQNTPASISEIENAISNQNWEAIRQAAHKMKPSFNYVGLKELSGISAKIEDLAKRNEDMEMIKTNIEQIKKVCEIAYTELEHEIKTIINN
ncbi:MAG: response regulator [Bacteroidetes bacterium]|nr:response regulator [Bacteroidota bacterium]